jgi:hypothetical protein
LDVRWRTVEAFCHLPNATGLTVPG